jgi:hypothetical protein
MKKMIQAALPCFLLLLFATNTMVGQRGSGAARASAQTSVNRGGNNNANVNRNANANVNRNANVNQNANINRNVNVNDNRNVNVNRDVDVNVRGGYYGGGGCCYHPVATAAAVTAATVATAAVVGSMVNTLPPACSAVSVNGMTYQQCGSTWYQPQFVGSSTSYVVVNAPR